MESMRHAYDLEKEGKAFIIASSRHMEMSTYGMNIEANQELYELGLEDYRNGEAKLKAFLAR